MTKLEEIEAVCDKHMVRHARDIFDISPKSVYIDLECLERKDSFKSFMSEIPGGCLTCAVYTGDEAVDEIWQRKICLCIAIED